MPTRIMLAAVLAATSLSVAACAPSAQPYTPSDEYPPEQPPKTGGPCGDGTVLQPGQHCP